MTVVPFKRLHLVGLELQPAQAASAHLLTDARWVRAIELGRAVTLLDDAGNVLAIGGVTLLWPGRAQAWALLSNRVDARNMAAVHCAARRRLAELQADLRYYRIEATVRAGFSAGRRWLESLGFKFEGWMRHYDPMDGADHALYARVAHG